MKKNAFIVQEGSLTGAIGINRQVYENLKDEFSFEKIGPEIVYYEKLPIIGLILNYFTLYEKRNNFDWVVATSFAGLPFLEKNRIIEIFHGVDSAGLIKINDLIKNGLEEEKPVKDWFSVAGHLFTEKINDLPPKLIVAQIAEKICAENAKAIIAVSSSVKKDLINLFNIEPKKINVIFNGIPDFWFEKKNSDSDFCVFYPSRFNFRIGTTLIKGHDRMYKILGNLKDTKKIIFANFVKAVSNDFQSAMTKILKEGTGAEIVTDATGKDLKDRYNSGSVILSTSRVEACQLVLLEGMAAELIPVTYQVGVVDEVIEHGKNGFIVNNEEEAIDVIKYLRDHPKERMQIASNAYETAKQLFTFERMISDYRKVFKKVIVD